MRAGLRDKIFEVFSLKLVKFGNNRMKIEESKDFRDITRLSGRIVIGENQTNHMSVGG